MADRREVKIGQIWREVDRRFDAERLPHKEVIGFETHPDGVVRVLLLTHGRTTKAKVTRFNGKNTGYELIRDVTS